MRRQMNTLDCSHCQDASNIVHVDCVTCESTFCFPCSTSFHLHGDFKPQHILSPIVCSSVVCLLKATIVCTSCDLHYCKDCCTTIHLQETHKNHEKLGSFSILQDESIPLNEKDNYQFLGSGLQLAMEFEETNMEGEKSNMLSLPISTLNPPTTTKWDTFSMEKAKKSGFGQWPMTNNSDSKNNVTMLYSSLNSLPALPDEKATNVEKDIVSSKISPLVPPKPPTLVPEAPAVLDAEQLKRLLVGEQPTRHVLLHHKSGHWETAGLHALSVAVKGFGEVHFWHTVFADLGIIVLSFYDLHVAMSAHYYLSTLGVVTNHTQYANAVGNIEPRMLHVTYSIPLQETLGDMQSSSGALASNPMIVLHLPHPHIPLQEIALFVSQWGSVLQVLTQDVPGKVVVHFCDIRNAFAARRDWHGLHHRGGILRVESGPFPSPDIQARISRVEQLCAQWSGSSSYSSSQFALPPPMQTQWSNEQHHHQSVHPMTSHHGYGDTVQSNGYGYGQFSTPRTNTTSSRGGGRGGTAHRRESGPNEFVLHIEKVKDKSDNRTTLMIRNIPNKYSQAMMLEEINAIHFEAYDFFYLPIDFKNKCNMGYAFINFIVPDSILEFYREFNDKGWRNFNSEKICAISYARLQGKAAMIARFQNSSLLEKEASYRPLVFASSGPSRGKVEPFPLPKVMLLSRKHSEEARMATLPKPINPKPTRSSSFQGDGFNLSEMKKSLPEST